MTTKTTKPTIISSSKLSLHRVNRHREAFAWFLVLIQFLFILTNFKTVTIYNTLRLSPASPSTIIQREKQQPKQQRRRQNGDVITTHLTDDEGVSYTKIFHTASSVEDPLHGGTCWCTTQYDDFCACTPSLAIDVVLASGPDHVWLVKRKDTGLYAAMGGFVEVGETTADAVIRELSEETGFTTTTPPQLFGMYDDPQRDVKRYRHSVSAVYILQIPLDQQPVAGDDVKQVTRVALDDIEKLDFFIDHKTIFTDYKRWLAGEKGIVGDGDKKGRRKGRRAVDYNVPTKRSVCVNANANAMKA